MFSDPNVEREGNEMPEKSSTDEQSARAFSGIRNLAEKVTPWLIDVGSWIFGGLTAVNLVVISALITVGPSTQQFGHLPPR